MIFLLPPIAEIAVDTVDNSKVRYGLMTVRFLIQLLISLFIFYFLQPEARIIIGFISDRADLNGIYEATEDMSEGMPVYRNLNDLNRWLMYYPASKKWALVRTENKSKENFAAFIVCGPPCLLLENGP